MKNKGRVANTIFFLSLLCIFVIGSVFIVSYQIIGYQKIVEDNARIENEYTPLSYLTNKVRTYDEENKIYKQSIEDADVLCLEDEEGILYVYEYKGYLCELYANKQYDIHLSDGDKIFDLDDFAFTFKEDAIVFQITQAEETKEVVVSLHHRKGVER